MFPILEAKNMGPDIYYLKLKAPDIAKAHKAGQFIILRINEQGERIPLTVADKDSEAGTIDLIYQAVGKSTYELSTLKSGDSLLDLVGPLGKPTDVKNYGNVVMVGGGLGIAPIYPITKAMKEAGNNVYSILGARSKDLIILEDKMRAASGETFICTDDGSYGEKGLVTNVLKRLIEEKGPINLVVAIGPAIMMKFVAALTKEYNIHTFVSLNTIMIDGTGMCGGCRVNVDGEPKFVCVDGPEFDGHKVDFDLMMKRLAMYKDVEKDALAKFKENHKCSIGLDK